MYSERLQKQRTAVGILIIEHTKMKWLRESNRMKHLVGILIVSLLGTILMGIGCIGGMEFKDVHHQNGSKPIKEWTWQAWDWLDVLAGIIGAVIALIIHILFYVIIIKV